MVAGGELPVAKYKHKIQTVDITDKMGDRLRDRREDFGYTRAQVIERAGMSERYLTAIENEGSIPTVAVLNDLLHSLGMSADEIFFPDVKIEDPELDHMIRLFSVCDKRERKIVLNLIDTLIDSRQSE